MTTLVHRFQPRGAAREAMSCRADEVLLAGPAGTGKSRACLEKMHLMCMLNPGMRALIVRKTAASLATSALKTYERDVAAEAMMDGTVSYYGGSAREPAQYRYSNGASIALGGMDQPMKVMSTEYDLIYVQEATELNVTGWEALTTRLRNGRVTFQQIIADCNPDHPTHWLKQRCDNGQTVMLHSRHQDNPRYFRPDGTHTVEGAAYMAKLDALTGVRRLRLRDGQWAAAEGVIYEWDPQVHLIDRFQVPDDWERWWAIDFGYTNPFVWQDWTRTPDDQLILVREIYQTGLLVEDAAALIRDAHTDGNGRARMSRPRAVVCDHDAEDRATFTKHIGFGTVAANKNVREGIEAVASRLKVRPNGKPGLALMRDATIRRDPSLADRRKPTGTAEEIPGYIWNEAKDVPVKENDHGCDAKRYLVAEVDLRGTTRVRFG